MHSTESSVPPKIIKRLNANLPDPLARFVGEITGDNGLYETPSEFVRDLIRRYMEQTRRNEHQAINRLLAQSISENDYSPWKAQDMQQLRNEISGE